MHAHYNICDNSVMLDIHIILLNIKLRNRAHGQSTNIYCTSTSTSARFVHSESEGRPDRFFLSELRQCEIKFENDIIRV